jgi:hypothetical protein
MKTKIENAQSTYGTSTTASRKGQLCRLVLAAIFTFGFAISASAASWIAIKTSPSGRTMAGIQTGSAEMWGHDGTGNGYEYDNSTLTLVETTTTPEIGELAVGENKTLFVLDPSHNVYQYDFKTKKFEIIPGATLTTIGSGEEGTWGVNLASGDVYVYEPSTNSFNPPPHGEPSEKFQTISVGNFAIGPWALDTSGNPWLYNTNTDFFDETSGTTLVQISVGEGEAWGVDSKGAVWEYMTIAEKWMQPEPGAVLKNVEVGGNSNIWGVTTNGEIYKFNVKKLKFELVSPQPPEAIDRIRVSDGGAGIFVLANSGNVYKYK